MKYRYTKSVSGILVHFLYVFLLVLIVPTGAFAHAHIQSTSPKKNAVLKSSPSEVKIVFSEPLRIQESYIKVFSGRKLLSEASPSLAPDQVTVSEELPELAPGKYTVKWKAVCLCSDHHATSGSYEFTVK